MLSFALKPDYWLLWIELSIAYFPVN